jgi:carbamoyltransferase
MSHILGISAGFHDASASVISRDGEIVFAGHSERYSKIKNDLSIHPDLIKDCMQWNIDTIAYYERPWMHNVQKIYSGQYRLTPWTVRGVLKNHLRGCKDNFINKCKVSNFSHHLSHAAAGFQTSPYSEAAVVVIDAIGELDTISIYHATYDVDGNAQYDRLWKQKYPHSLGLFYSAITKQIGLKPMEDEYVTMGMAAYGSDLGAVIMKNNFFSDISSAELNQNLHIGIDNGHLKKNPHIHANKENIAASAQRVVEEAILEIMRRAKKLVNSDNLVFMGGVALNCVANSRLSSLYSNIWIMPNPGDAGSSLGAAALEYKKPLKWKNAYLGHEIRGDYPVNQIVDKLVTDKIVGVASGKAEFGPRALGNRSLLADPRGEEIKDKVNEIKKRQKFRPFAPAILEEHVHDYFEMPASFQTSPYMQCVARVKHPELFPAITHVDGTARVQTVPKDDSGFRKLLELWYVWNGCPMLLNTSLNIRGEPMVNDRKDADRFQKKYGVTVCS